MAFTEFDPSVDSVEDLVSAIFASEDTLTLVEDSITFEGGVGQASLYDGTLPLGIGSGILLTSGDGTPPQENTLPSYTETQQGNTDSDLQTVANSAFAGAGTVQDANILEFQFTIEDSSVKSISFDLVFGSDEFPEFSNSEFVDVAGVFVNGNNVALFNNAPEQPLSIINNNLELGNFINNDTASFFPIEEESEVPIEEENEIPIEYDGISSVLSIIAPVEQGENTLKFAVGDTGDQALDSGLFIANVDTSSIDIAGVSSSGGGSGILISITEPNSDNILVSGDVTAELAEFFNAVDSDDTDDVVDAGAGNDVVDTGGGNDVVNAGPGDDIVDTGDGNDVVDGGPGNDSAVTGTGDDKVTGSGDDDTLVGGPGEDNLSGGDGEDDLRGGGDSDKLWGGNDADILQGNSGNDILLGGSGDDTLLGGIGRDRLNGGAGNDVLTGGVSIDRFIFNSNKAFKRNDFGVDEITDFSKEQGDIILLDLDSFTAIESESGTGFTIEAEFAIVDSDEVAATVDAVIVYNESNGNLFYNPNGSGSEFGSGGLFATLTGTPSLDAEDFFLR